MAVDCMVRHTVYCTDVADVRMLDIKRTLKVFKKWENPDVCGELS